MKETERSEKRQGTGWRTERSGDTPFTAWERFFDNRGSGDKSFRTRYDQEAITQPLRRPSDDEIVPPGRR